MRWPSVRGGVREAIEVAGLAVWGGAQRRTKLTDQQLPLLLLTLAPALPLELGTIGLYYAICLKLRSVALKLDL